MQKIVRFCNTGRIFLPGLLFIFLSGRWLGFMIGAWNPAGAADFFTQSGYTTPVIQSAANPFEGFTLGNKDSTVQTDLPQQKTAYHPGYTVVEEFMTSAPSDIVLQKDSCFVKNLTHHTADQVKQLMLAPVSFKVDKNSAQPQILIYHTHATESYVPTADMAYDAAYAYRSTDTAQNMVAVGKVMADTLNSLGYTTIHDTTLHDYPSYNGSYDLSKATVEKYLKMYPSIKIVLDIHRDAVERNGALINPVTTVNGVKCAQMMIISGCDNGYMNMPNYPENLKFATNLQNRLAKDRPGLMRPVLFDYRNYNQQLTTGSLLVEIGTHGSTLQQAKNSAGIFSQSLAGMLDNMQ